MRNGTTEPGTPVASSGAAFPGWSPQFATALQRLAIPNRQRARGQRVGDVRAATRGRALEFADHRPYQVGDEPRLVDWRAYARLGRLFLKQHEEERARTTTILLDVSASMDWGDGDTHKGRFARQIAAALIWIAVSRHDAVAGWLLRDGEAHRLPPVSSLNGVGVCFQQLAEVEDAGRTSLASAVRAAIDATPRGPTLLISDLMEPAWADAIMALSGIGQAAVIQVLAPAEWAPPLGEEVELLDAESGDTVLTRLGTPELAAYASQLDSFLADMQRECAQRRIASVTLNSGTTLQDVLFHQLPAAGILEGS